jgi:hypothetical protein
VPTGCRERRTPPVSSADVHPIERLRYVARSGRAHGEETELAQEAARALAGLGDDHAGLVTACRRMLDRHPAVGPLWWLSARVLTAPDPVRAARAAAEELVTDPTPSLLAERLPDDAVVCVIGWPELAADALSRRPDLRLLVVDVHDELAWASRRRESAGGWSDSEIVPGPGLGAAAAAAHVVRIEASAFGAGGVVATSGSHAAAAVARLAGVEVWVVAGRGRALTPALWEGLAARLGQGGAPWCGPDEILPLGLVDQVILPDGAREPAVAAASITGPVAPELLRATPRMGDAGPAH